MGQRSRSLTNVGCTGMLSFVLFDFNRLHAMHANINTCNSFTLISECAFLPMVTGSTTDLGFRVRMSLLPWQPGRPRSRSGKNTQSS